MDTTDIFGMTNKLDPAALSVIVTRLEARAKHPYFMHMLQEYLDAMGIDSAKTVLDLGCGTGIAARTIALRAGFKGKIVGVDLNPYLIEAAARLADEDRAASRTEFRVGDAQNLDFPPDEFDAVVAHTLVSHVGNPVRVLKEAARVVRSGGMESSGREPKGHAPDAEVAPKGRAGAGLRFSLRFRRSG